ncbi:MAG: winged helix-turn-helix transcriptional regulator [Planctomycetes bacterium]|nr:winged helix-turn-helix transcriptional regulator [Planctomycetota bacterium]
MTPTMLAGVAEQFRALGEPSRLVLMNLLFDGERTVGELTDASGLSLANASKHLGLLHDVGWVTRRKDGLNVVYRLADERTFALCELMCDRVRELAAAEAGTTARRRGRA